MLKMQTLMQHPCPERSGNRKESTPLIASKKLPPGRLNNASRQSLALLPGRAFREPHFDCASARFAEAVCGALITAADQAHLSGSIDRIGSFLN
jgi:hypothetical protein